MGITLRREQSARIRRRRPAPDNAARRFSVKRRSESSDARTSAEHAKDPRVFLALLLGLYFLILEPILRADRSYNDDLKRSLFGRTGWDSNGRPLTTLLMKVLQCYDHALVDISPLTQIGAIAILAYIGTMIGKKYAVGSPTAAALVAFPLGAQPFFLENLSYKFDALSMSVAMLLCLLPVLLLARTRRDFWLGTAALFAGLNFYQPAINVYFIFVILEIALYFLERTPPQRLFKQAGWRFMQAATAMATYQILVGVHINGWVKQRSETIRSFDQVHLLGKNLFDFLDFLGAGFNAHWWLYLAPALIVLGLMPVAVAIRYWNDRQPDGAPLGTAIAVAFCVSLPALALVCIPGPMLVLVDPPIVPRVLPGVGALLAAALIFLHRTLKTWNFSKWWSVLLSGALALGMGTIASAYGNASTEQKAFEEHIASHIADDLAAITQGRSLHAYLIVGAAGYAPVAQHIVDQLPIVESLVPTYLQGDNTFLTHNFLSYYIRDLGDLRSTSSLFDVRRLETIKAQSECSSRIRSAASYDISVVEDVAVVTLHSLPQ